MSMSDSFCCYFTIPQAAWYVRHSFMLESKIRISSMCMCDHFGHVMKLSGVQKQQLNIKHHLHYWRPYVHLRVCKCESVFHIKRERRDDHLIRNISYYFFITNEGSFWNSPFLSCPTRTGCCSVLLIILVAPAVRCWGSQNPYYTYIPLCPLELAMQLH